MNCGFEREGENVLLFVNKMIVVVVNDVRIAAVDPAMAPAINNVINKDTSKHKIEYLDKRRLIVNESE